MQHAKGSFLARSMALRLALAVAVVAPANRLKRRRNCKNRPLGVIEIHYGRAQVSVLAKRALLETLRVCISLSRSLARKWLARFSSRFLTTRSAKLGQISAARHNALAADLSLQGALA